MTRLRPMPPASDSPWPRRVSCASAWVALSCGLSGCLGWLLGVDVLKSLAPGLVTMKFSTAVALVVAAVALIVAGRPRSPGRDRLRVAAGTILTLTGGAVLAQYLLGVDAGLDRLLFSERPGAPGTSHAGRMAPNAAANLVLLGFALVLLHRPVLGRHVAASLAGLAGLVALVALLGYLGGVTSLYGVSQLTQMAIPTGIAFVALAAGVITARPGDPLVCRLRSDAPGAALLRRLLPAAVGVPLALGAVRLAGQEAGLYGTDVGTWLLVSGIVVLSVGALWHTTAAVDRAEAARRDAELQGRTAERTARIVRCAHEPFVSIGAGGTILGWNRAAETTFGWSEEEILGRSVAETLVPPARRADAVAVLARADATGDVGFLSDLLETTLLRRDGVELSIEPTVSAVREHGEWSISGFLRDVTERRRRDEALRASRLEVVERLARAAEYRDDETGEHTRRVGELAGSIATELGLPTKDVALLRQAAPLHDVGKIGVPDGILLKPGRLSPPELETMRTHTVIGAELLAGGDFALLEMARRIALSHHERWQGGGYPHGTAGEAIPLVARIVAVADVFDALTHERPYKAAWTVDAAVEEITRQRGEQFDPAVVDAFLRVQDARSLPAAAPDRALAPAVM